MVTYLSEEDALDLSRKLANALIFDGSPISYVEDLIDVNVNFEEVLKHFTHPDLQDILVSLNSLANSKSGRVGQLKAEIDLEGKLRIEFISRFPLVKTQPQTEALGNLLRATIVDERTRRKNRVHPEENL